MVDPLSYFSFQPVLHDWCNKGCGMCYPVCGMVHIKEPLLLIEKSSPCGTSRFPLSLSEWCFTICPTPYNRKWNVLTVSCIYIYIYIYIYMNDKNNVSGLEKWFNLMVAWATRYQKYGSPTAYCGSPKITTILFNNFSNVFNYQNKQV